MSEAGVEDSVGSDQYSMMIVGKVTILRIAEVMGM